MKIAEAFARYSNEMIRDGKATKTIRNYNTAYASLTRVIPDIPITLLTQTHIATWKDDMLRRSNQTSSIARNISCLKVVLDYLRDDLGMNVLDPRLIRRIKVRTPQRTYLEIPEVQAMLDATDNLRNRAILACLFSFGCRIGELLALNKTDIVNTEQLVLTDFKTDSEYTVYIDPTARACLNEYLQFRTDTLKPLFISGQRRRITVSRVEQIVHEISDVAGINKNVTPHVYRHTHATDLHVNGADLMDVQVALGHKSINTTRIYTHAPNWQKKEVQQKYHSKINA